MFSIDGNVQIQSRTFPSGISDDLSEERLAIFDLLIRPHIKLNKKEKEQVKKVAKDLLDTLKAERLVLDWRKTQKTRAAVRVAVFLMRWRLRRPRPTLKSCMTRNVRWCTSIFMNPIYGANQSAYVVAEEEA